MPETLLKTKLNIPLSRLRASGQMNEIRVDDAALHGLLKKVRDLGLPLISVNQAEPGEGNNLTGKEQGVV